MTKAERNRLADASMGTAGGALDEMGYFRRGLAGALAYDDEHNVMSQDASIEGINNSTEFLGGIVLRSVRDAIAFSNEKTRWERVRDKIKMLKLRRRVLSAV